MARETDTETSEVLLLANPAAGGGAALRIAYRAVPVLAELGVAAEVVAPPSAADARPAVREALARCVGRGQPPRTLVAVGGDGTVRLAAAIARDLDLPLGIIPAGTGNGAAYSLGLPLDPWEACRVVAEGEPGPCDLGRVDFCDAQGRFLPEFFVNVAGAGLDAAISRVYQTERPLLRGVPGYVVAALRSLVSFRAVPLAIEADGRREELEALLVAVGNGAFYGKGLRIVPSADPSDGVLDVLAVLAAGPRELSSLAARLLAGRHADHPKVRTFRARQVVIRVPPGPDGSTPVVRPVPVHADGDVIGVLPVRVSVVQRAIRLVQESGRRGSRRPRTELARPGAGKPSPGAM